MDFKATHTLTVNGFNYEVMAVPANEDESGSLHYGEPTVNLEGLTAVLYDKNDWSNAETSAFEWDGEAVTVWGEVPAEWAIFPIA